MTKVYYRGAVGALILYGFHIATSQACCDSSSSYDIGSKRSYENVENWRYLLATRRRVFLGCSQFAERIWS